MNSILKFAGLFLVLSLAISCKSKKSENLASDAGEVAATMGKSYQVNATNSMVLWTAKKITGSGHNGTVNVSSGNMSMKEGVLEGGSFTLDMNSISVSDLEGGKKASLEGHLKGTVEGKEVDFFDVTKFPTGKFEITKATRLMNNPDGNYVINGNLTLKDVTKQISFKATVDESNGKISMSTSPFMINRTDWGIKYGSSTFIDGLKDNAINDEVEMVVRLSAS